MKKEKVLTALKAVYYVAKENPRFKYGEGIWVEDVHNIETCQKISFKEAAAIVEKIIYSTERETEVNRDKAL